MDEERDSKGRFKKGITPKGAVPINEGIAKEYQARSVASRRERKALADVVREALEKKVAGGEITKMEYLAEKAINNHAKGEMTFKDLRDLQKIIGEDVKTVNIKGVAPIEVKNEKDAEEMRTMLNNITVRKGE